MLRAYFVIWQLTIAAAHHVEAREQAEDAAIVRRVSVDAQRAIRAAAAQYTLPRAAVAELTRICIRESRCREIGPHAGDAKHARGQLRRAVRAGIVDFEACEGLPRDAGEWGTRGPFGLAFF